MIKYSNHFKLFFLTILMLAANQSFSQATKEIKNESKKYPFYTETYSVIKKGEHKGKRHGKYAYIGQLYITKGEYALGVKEGIWVITTKDIVYKQYFNKGHEDSLVFMNKKEKNVMLFSADGKDTLEHQKFYPGGMRILIKNGISHYYLYDTMYLGNNEISVKSRNKKAFASDKMDLDDQNRVTTTYYSNGSIMARKHYLEGSTSATLETVFYQNGDTAFVKKTLNDTNHMVYRGYYPGNMLAFIFDFESKRLQAFRRFNVNGTADPKFQVVQGNGLVYTGLANHSVSPIKNGLLDGVKYIFDGGTLFITTYNGGISMDIDNNRICARDKAFDPATIHVDAGHISDDFMVKATFKEGINEMYRFIGNTIKVPELALEEGQSGTVIVSFVVEKDGSISNLEACNTKKLGYGCEEAAMSVVGQMNGMWKAASLAGFPVRMRFSLPIRFQLN